MDNLINLLEKTPSILKKAEDLDLVTPSIARKVEFWLQNPKGGGERQLPQIMHEIRTEILKTQHVPDGFDKIFERYKSEHKVFLKEFLDLLKEETQLFLTNLNPLSAIQTLRNTEQYAIIILSERYRAAVGRLYNLYSNNYQVFLSNNFEKLAAELVQQGYEKKSALTLSKNTESFEFQNQPFELEKAALLQPTTVLTLMFNAIKAPFMAVASLGMVFFMLFAQFPTMLIRGMLQENPWLYYALGAIMLAIFYFSINKARKAAKLDDQNRQKQAYLLMKTHAETVIMRDLQRFNESSVIVYSQNLDRLAANNAQKTNRREALDRLQQEIEALN